MFNYFLNRKKNGNPRFRYSLGTSSLEVSRKGDVVEVVVRDIQGYKRIIMSPENAGKIRDWFLEVVPRKPADVIKMEKKTDGDGGK